MKLFTELNVESASVLTEEHNGEKNFYIEGIFLQSEIKNRNGRMYPRSVMEAEVDRYNRDKVLNKTAYGELGHPAGPTINPERISHRIESLTWDGNNVIGKARVMNTPYGLIVQECFKSGGRIGVSSRGLGSLKEQNGVNVVQSDFYLATAADVVTDPSAPDAFVNGIMEGADWVLQAGTWVPMFAEKAQKSIKEASKSNLEEAKLRAWQAFLSNL